jgi:C4-dicarboxylate-specific signal transduction histidine kinase
MGFLFQRGLAPHGYCLLWDPSLITLHVASDALIALAYFSIPVALWRILQSRRDLEFGWVLGLFALFILSCGATHVISILVLWVPVYGLEGVVKAISAGLSIFTAIALWPLIPKLLSMQLAEARLEKAQDELLYLTRVSAMGAMASTLAHEINQPLTAVANYVQTSRSLLEADADPGTETIREALGVAEDEVLRAGQIVRRLREFVARGNSGKSIEPLSELITESCTLSLAGASSQGIASRVELAADRGSVFVDRIQIQQVLINLISNAVEAMTPHGNGEVVITSRTNGQFVCIGVTDTGPGLPEEISGRLFQAFLSTKSHGVGLGLSICRTIVEAHGGKIWYETAAGGGAAFQFTVPLAEFA